MDKILQRQSKSDLLLQCKKTHHAKYFAKKKKSQVTSQVVHSQY